MNLSMSAQIHDCIVAPLDGFINLPLQVKDYSGVFANVRAFQSPRRSWYVWEASSAACKKSAH
jgi:hypothetical protein